MLTLTPHHLVPSIESSALPSVVDALAVVPEEDVWLASGKSRHTREAYARDVWHFMRTLAITSRAQLRAIDHRAVIAWERYMREAECPPASGFPAHRLDSPQIRDTTGSGPRLFGPFDAGHVHHDRPGEWGEARRCPNDGWSRRSVDHAAV
jgi:hypothetical protein